MSPPRISVIIPTYQRRSLVEAAVLALGGQVGAPPFEVVVVVDGSTDGTAEALAALDVAVPLRVVEQPNQGAAVARNRGASEAAGEILLFLDDDMEAAPDLVAQHDRSHREGADAVVGRMPLHPDSPSNLVSRGVGTWAAGLARRLAEPDRRWSYDDVVTGQLSVRASLFRELGGFDERFTKGGSYGAEDVELGWRLIDGGHRIVFNPDAVSHQRYVTTAAGHLRQYRQVGWADVAIVRKHPELADVTFAGKRRESQIHRLVWRPAMAAPGLARRAVAPVRSAVVRRVDAGRRDRVTTWGFFLVRAVMYWCGVREAGGLPGPRPALVLCYHAVADLSDDPVLSEYGVPPEQLAAQLDALVRLGYRFVHAADVVDAVEGRGVLPRRSVAVTFDDAYTDLLDAGLPVLEARGVPATVFAVSGRLGGANEWDHRLGARSLALLDAAGLAKLASRGIEVGAHARTHRPLRGLPAEELDGEVAGSADDLASSGLDRPSLFAYPHGSHDRAVRAAVARAGYRAAFTVDPGRVRPGDDPFALRRVQVLRRDTGLRFVAKVLTAGRAGTLVPAVRSRLGRAKRRLVPGRRGGTQVS